MHSEKRRTAYPSKVLKIAFCIFLFFFGRADAQNTNLPVYPASARVNYTRTWTATAPDPTASHLITRPLTDVKQVTRYFDGFGKPMQTVAMQESPAGKDMVIQNYYDPVTGSETYKYLPFAANAATAGDLTTDGNFKTDPYQEQVAFYNAQLNGQPGETNIGPTGNLNWAYRQTNFETSPLVRVLNDNAPGANWVGSQGTATPHNVQLQHLMNRAADLVLTWNIPAWTVSAPEQNIIPTNGPYYGDGQLYKTITTDEHGNQSIEFRDLYGQLVLKKIQLQSSSPLYTPLDNGTGSGDPGWLCTYYVYDDHGKLRFVITPDVVAQMMVSNTSSISQTQADELCYRYEYDQLGRMIIKKAPGTPSGAQGEVWMVYDQRNRLVMSQDGNMRTNSQWLCNLYDGLDRQTMTGMITYTAPSLAQLQQQVTTQTTNENSSPAIQPNITLSTPGESGDQRASQSIILYNGFSTAANASFSAAIIPSNIGGAGYSVPVNTYPLPLGTTITPLTATFYDNYTNTPSALPTTIDASTNGTGNTVAFTTSYNASPVYAQPITQSPMTQGLVTGTTAMVCGTNGGQYIPTVSFYDEKGRVIQAQTINYTNGKDISTSQYNWSGKVVSSLVSHNYASSSNPQSHLLLTAIGYDPMGRLLTVSKTINSTINGVVLTGSSTNTTNILTCGYDELGRLANKALGGGLESLAYGYNVRGWLMGINQGYISGSSTSNYFGMELGYDKTTSVAPGNSWLHPAFNGSIAGTVWKSKGDGVNRKYDVSYDNANRLAAAGFMQNSAGSTWDNGFIDFSVSGPGGGPIGYDANGNIQAMSQNGFAQGGKLAIDQLTYHYLTGAGNSNRLSYVDDGANVTNSTLGDFHFPGAAKTTSSVDYTYDADANTTSDYNRSITNISYYPCPNLPQVITTNKGSITYFYDAAGNKLRKQVTENNVPINSMIVNNVIVNNVTTNITTTTTYVNGFVYKSIAYSNPSLAPLNTGNTDILQLIGTEEGRLRFKPASGSTPASFVHDYLIRDHQGNTRVGITDEQQQDIYAAATGETTSVTVNGALNTAQNYEALYYNFNPGDFVSTSSLGAWYSTMLTNYGQILNENGNGMPANNDPYSVPASSSQKVFQLCGNPANNPTGDNFGPGMTLKVMAGDQINIYGTSFWHNIGNLPVGGYPVGNVLASLLGAFGGSSAVTSTGGHSLLDGSAFNASTTGPTGSLLSPMFNSTPNQSGTQAPYAGINYIIFDDQFRPQGTVVGMDMVSQTTDAEKLHSISVTIPKNGYIFVYSSNQSPINVYFDNLQVVHTRGPLMEEAHYYPSGLLMAGISDRAWNKTPNYFHYQGKEMQNQEWNDGTGLEQYDFSARFYDPQLGRWNTQDPAGQYSSPYLGMGNNWMNGVDPDGRDFWNTAGTIGIIAGSALAAYFTAGLSLTVEQSAIFGGAVALGGYAGASLESGSWNPGQWNGNAWKGAITGALVAGSVAVGGEEAFGGTTLTSAFGAGDAGIITSAANGVLQNLVVGEATAQVTKQTNLSWNDAFIGSVTGAVTGAFKGLNPITALTESDGTQWTGLGLRLPQGAEESLLSSLGRSSLYNAGNVIGNSILTNLLNGVSAFSKVNIPLGPTPFALTLGRGQTLFQASANTGAVLNGWGLLNDAIYSNSSYDWGTLIPNTNDNLISNAVWPYVKNDIWPFLKGLF